MTRAASSLLCSPQSHAVFGRRGRCTSWSTAPRQKRNAQSRRASCLAKSNGAELREELLTAIEGTDRGLATSYEQQSAIFAVVDKLVEVGKGTVTTGEELSATWKLAWTTEKEVLFLLKNAGWFGTKGGDVYQVVDVENKSLQNVITFPPEGAFVVTSSIQVASDQRVRFKFNKARLDLPDNKKIPFPPYGEGWFQSVYMDDYVRVAKDIRGDTLVVTREGAPRAF
ncbi:hypothetical protein BSKO_00685 [Bryopsis sp. KO-2023]|nr:hypothetical protein BSKO_00685 [Bryopsis sp. KO-2023]